MRPCCLSRVSTSGQSLKSTPARSCTIVGCERFRGTRYRAANWIHVGQTQGRGKLDTHNQFALPVKDILLKPLHPHWRSILNR